MGAFQERQQNRGLCTELCWETQNKNKYMYREVDEQVRNAFGVRFGCFDKLVTDAFEDFFLDNI